MSSYGMSIEFGSSQNNLIMFIINYLFCINITLIIFMSMDYFQIQNFNKA